MYGSRSTKVRHLSYIRAGEAYETMGPGPLILERLILQKIDGKESASE